MPKLIFAFALFLISSTQATANQICNSYDFRYFMLKIYDVHLCREGADSLTYDNLYQNNFSLIIDYSRNISSQELVDASLEEIEKNHLLSSVQKQNYIAKLNEIFPNVKKNDRIEAKYFTQNGETKFYHNRKFSGAISDKEFSQKFLDIWLGKKTSYPQMTMALLNAN